MVGQAKAQTQQKSASNEQLLMDIAQAHREWAIAMEHFNHATEPDVIDDAIYLLIAAERRYEGLMRIARRQHLYVDLHGQISALPSHTRSVQDWAGKDAVAVTTAVDPGGSSHRAVDQ